MSFLTQGKTNWQYISIVFVLAIVVGGVSLWYLMQVESPVANIDITENEAPCDEGEELIVVPTTKEFKLTNDSPKEYCSTRISKYALKSPNGEFEVYSVSLEGGPIIYNFIQGPTIFSMPVFIKFKNLFTKEEKEISIVSLSPQTAIKEIKEIGVPIGFTIYGGPSNKSSKWSSDNKEFWGSIKIYSPGDPPIPSYQSLYKINVENWEFENYLIPNGLMVNSLPTNALNIEYKAVLYGEKTEDELLLNVYNIDTKAKKTITSYSLDFMKEYRENTLGKDDYCNGWGELFLEICNPYELEAVWIDEKNVSYIDLKTGNQVEFLVF